MTRAENPLLTAPLTTSSRALVLAAVAADVYTGYAALRRRAERRPRLVNELDWQAQHRRGAARALDTAISLGGVLIKAGQFASTRSDLLPTPYISALTTLQDRVPPHPWLAIEPIIAAQIGRPLPAVFASIEHRPVAAASLAQVHRARLLDGREVAIKVQYPEIASLVAADLGALAGIVETLARLEPEVRLQPIVDHLRATLPLELDFRREAQAMDRLRAAMAHRDDTVIPQVFHELSGKQVLVMEFVQGIKVTDRATLVAAGIDPERVAWILNDLYAEQILELGLLHADPHPGNLLAQPGPRVVLLDHGLTVELEPRLVLALARMVRALTTFDFSTLLTLMNEVGVRIDPNADITALLQLAGVLMGGEPANGAIDAGRRLGASIGAVPLDLVVVGRALGLLGGVTQELDPELDVLALVAAHAEKRLQAEATAPAS